MLPELLILIYIEIYDTLWNTIFTTSILECSKIIHPFTEADW